MYNSVSVQNFVDKILCCYWWNIHVYFLIVFILYMFADRYG